jgi:maltose alpha-D-glucosyltransferase/alpha-amylase
MIRSFHYAAYGSLFLDNQIRKEDFAKLMPLVDQWQHYMSQFFIKAYLETVGEANFVPKNKEDLEILLTTFLMEKAVYEIDYEVNNRPDWVIIPLRGVKTLLKKDQRLKVMTASVQATKAVTT